MIAFDVNVLIASFKEGSPVHEPTKAWVHELLSGTQLVGLPDESITGFIRLVTNRRIFSPATTPDDAVAYAEALLAAPHVVRLHPGRGHWTQFARLVRAHGLRAGDIPDAHLAALCIEQGATLATFDRGFARFAELRTTSPAA